MSTYNTLVHNDVGGDSLTVEALGSIVIGNATFTVTAAGKLVVSGLPTSDPAAAGEVWTNTGVLTVSQG